MEPTGSNSAGAPGNGSGHLWTFGKPAAVQATSMRGAAKAIRAFDQLDFGDDMRPSCGVPVCLIMCIFPCSYIRLKSAIC